MRRDAKVATTLFALLLALLLAACNLSVAPGPSNRVLSGPPVVQIQAPLPNSSYLEGVAVNIQAQVQNAGSGPAIVTFSADGVAFDNQTDLNSAGTGAFNAGAGWTASGAGAHVLSVVARRDDGSSSAPASVTVNVISQGAGPTQGDGDAGDGGSDGDAGRRDGEPAREPEPTDVPEPTSDRPMARVLRGAYVRDGPDTRFAPPIGSIAAGDQVELLAVNIHKTWYKIKYYNGEGWVFGSLLEVSGDVEDLPAVWGPPLPEPTPVPPTAAPVVVVPTAVPVANVNLVAGNMRHNQASGNIVCGQGFSVEIDVHNPNTVRSAGGTVHFLDYASRGGGVFDRGNIARVSANFAPIEPGQTIGVSAPMTIGFHYNETHTLRACINRVCDFQEPDVADEGHFNYTLRKGNCP